MKSALIVLWVLGALTVSLPGADGAGPRAEVFNTNRVTQIEIKLSEADWNKLRYEHREAEFFPEEGKAPPEDPYTWFAVEVMINGKSVGRGEVRKKGYIGSNDIRRPSLKLRLSAKGGNKADGVDDLDLTLNNNRQDPSLIRQYLAYEVFRRAKVPAPRCSFARVTVNGKDLGIYTSLEPINANFLKQHFTRADGNLYEGGRSDFRSNWVQNFQIKNKQKGDERSGAARADLEAATAALEKGQVSLLATLNSHFDTEEFFRFWAIESLINAYDGYAANMNNFYLYNDPATGKFAFIPWGADSTFNFGRPMNTAAGDPRSVIGIGILANRLYNSEDGAAKYRATLRSLLETVWDEKALLQEVNRLEALLSPSLPSQRDNFKPHVDNVRRFIQGRRSELIPELDGPVPALKSKPLELAKRRIVGRFTGNFSKGKAELSGTLWDEKLVFRETSFDIQTGDDGIIMQFVATTDSGRQHYIFLEIDPDSVATGKPIPIDNTRIQGTFGSDGRYIGILRGSLTLSKWSRTGSERGGEFTVEVFSKRPKPQ